MWFSEYYLFALIPMAAFFIGGLITLFWSLSPKTIRLIHHFVAGALVAAISWGIIIKLINGQFPVVKGFWFLLGVLVMSLVYLLTKRIEATPTAPRLFIGSLIDVLIFGYLFGLTFLMTPHVIILLGIAITLTTLAIGLIVSSRFTTVSLNKGKHISYLLLSSMALLIGAYIGLLTVRFLPQEFVKNTITLIAGALLFFAMEQYVKRAKGVTEATPSTASFIIGFLIISALEIWKL